MSSLRNILQRCASRNSILGGTPLQIQCTFNPVYSAYPTSISRQAYSSDANEAPKNDPVQKYLIEMMNAKKSPTNNSADQKAPKSKIVEDQKVSKASTFNKTDSMNSRPNTKSWPSVTQDQKTSMAPAFNNSDFRPRTPEAQSRTHQLLNTNRELKFRPTVTKDQKVYKASTFSNTDSMNSRPNIKFRPTVAEYQKAAKAPTFNNTDFRPRTPEAQSRTHQLLNTNRELLDEVSALLKRLQSFELKLTSEIQMNAKKSPTNIVEDQKVSKVPIFEASKAPTFNKTDSMNSRPNIKSWPSVTKDQKVYKASPFNKNLNLQKSRSNIVPEDKKSSKAFTADSTQKTPFGQMNSKNYPPKNYPPNVPADQKSKFTGISRQAYTSDVNEAPKNATFNKTNSVNSRPSVTEDQKASNAPIFNKNLNLRKYYITIRGLSKQTTHDSLREFYSQFGEIVSGKIIFPGESRQFGNVAFTSREAMDRALNSLPHCIDGKETKNVNPAMLGKKQLTLQVLYLSPKTTKESLRKFYSKFGMLSDCWTKQGTTVEIGQLGEVTFAYQKDMHRALDAQPHVIDGSEVLLLYATFDLDLKIEDVPEGVTEDDLIAFYSKYGQLRVCRLYKGRTGIPHAFVSFSAIDQINRAMDDCPHVINGKPMKLVLLNKSYSHPVSLFVGSLPENVTEETLRNEFSKHGKPVYWELRNDGDFNQSRPYGIVKYATEQGALKVLNSGPHTIGGAIVDVRIAKEANKSGSKEMSNK
ncbi:RNA recognition motif domain-containing protein [Ditylenchus destructor]|nr:RNA recognition motif domain-containing protein [Ditylenchus destructor]